MLEIIMSDFASLEAETAASEAEAQNTFERFMQDSRTDKNVKSKQIAMNTEDKEEAEHAAAAAHREWNAADDQLLAANRYYENLKPKCVDEGVSFEARDEAR